MACSKNFTVALREAIDGKKVMFLWTLSVPPLAPPTPQVLRTHRGVFSYKNTYKRLAAIGEIKRLDFHFWRNLYISGQKRDFFFFSRMASLRKAFKKKIWDYLGIFPNMRGVGVFSIPKTFVILTIALKIPLKPLKIT